MKWNSGGLMFILILLIFSFFPSVGNAINLEDGVETKAFGPSPISVDSRTLFRGQGLSQGRVSRMANPNYWRLMAEEFNAIYLHVLLYAKGDARYPVPKNQASLTLDRMSLAGLRYLQENEGFQIIVDAGLALGPEAGGSCNTRLSLSQFAERAAQDDFHQIKNLIDKGIKIDQLAIDGPFARIVRHSKKAFSCATGSSGGIEIIENHNAFTNGQAAIIVAKYLGRLKRKIIDYQNLNGLVAQDVKVNLALNLPNLSLKQGRGFSAQPGRFDQLDYVDVIQKFSTRPEYPALNEIVFDYPYSYLLNAQETESRILTERFEEKVLRIADLARILRGHPKTGLMVNTEGNIKPPADIAKAHYSIDDARLSSLGNVSGHEEAKYCIVVGSRERKNLLNASEDSSRHYSQMKLWNYNRCYWSESSFSRWQICVDTNQNSCRELAPASRVPNLAAKRNAYVRAETIRYYRHTESFYNQAIQMRETRDHQFDSLYFASWHDFPRNSKYYGAKVRQILRQNRP